MSVYNHCIGISPSEEAHHLEHMLLKLLRHCRALRSLTLQGLRGALENINGAIPHFPRPHGPLPFPTFWDLHRNHESVPVVLFILPRLPHSLCCGNLWTQAETGASKVQSLHVERHILFVLWNSAGWRDNNHSRSHSYSRCRSACQGA